MNPPAAVLGKQSAIVSGTARDHHVPDFEGCLSVKSVARGSARWRTPEAEYSVSESTCLLLNDRQRYTMTIESASPVTTFCVFFERGLVEDAWRTLESSDRERMDDASIPGTAPGFFERLEASDGRLFRGIEAFREGVLSRRLSPDQWDDWLHRLAAVVARERIGVRHLGARLGARHASTRNELRRRVLRGRDYLLCSLDRPIRLADAAAAASLSPFHFHRTFTRAFGMTPHRYQTLRRMERAAWLLERTGLRVTDICLECGFSSMASFGLLFRRHYGLSPRAFRTRSK